MARIEKIVKTARRGVREILASVRSHGLSGRRSPLERPSGRFGAERASRRIGAMAVAVAGLLAVAGDAVAQTVPTVTSVSLEAPDRAADSDTYGLGDRVLVRVSFSEGVRSRVLETMSVALDVGVRTRTAVYARHGSDGESVEFEYRFQAADVDGGGIAIPANAISGKIQSAADRNVIADLSHDPVPDDPLHKVDGSIAVAPRVARVSVNRPRRVGPEGWVVEAEVHRVGDVVAAYVFFDKPVRVTGQPRLALVLGEAVRQARFINYYGRLNRLRFEYGVQAWDGDTDGLSVPANALTLNGGTIALQDAPETAADLTHEATSGGQVDGRLVESPGVFFVGANQPIRDETYGRGEAIWLSLYLYGRVRISGEPELALRIGTKTRLASFEQLGVWERGHSVTFKYVVQAEDMDGDGIALAEDPLVFANGAITLAGDAGVALELADADVERLSGLFGELALRQVDGSTVSTPSVYRIWPWQRPAGGGRYGLGETIRAQVCFNSGVALSGQPRLDLDLGGLTRQAVPGAIFGGGCNYFRYVVQADDMASLGVGIPADALSVEGGSFTLPGDAGVAADLSHDPVTSADYYDYADRRVDGTAVSAPRVTGVAFTQAPSSGGWYGAGETIGVRVSFDKELAVAGEARLALDVGGETRHATLREAGVVVDSPRVAEDGDWLDLPDEHFAAFFDYVVQPGDLDADGVGVPANALSLNGGSMTFKAAPDVAADLTHAALDRDPWRPVDGGPAAGYADCDPWADPGPEGVRAFAHGYAVSACVEYDADGATVRRRASDYRLESGQSALFWFFDRDNVEILVKVLDGCAVNGHTWVFLGPVTDLAFNLEVMEQSTGKRWRYRNPGGRTAAPRSDTAAFPCDPAAANRAGTGFGRAPGHARPFHGGVPSMRAGAEASGMETDCEPGGASLTLSGGYEVSMCYETAGGRTGDALDFGLDSSQSGLLYFFDPDNVEVLIKVLDGCALNGYRWVFVAPVTDLAFNLHIDSPDGLRWTHRNRLGQTASSASDLSFFPCAPA